MIDRNKLRFRYFTIVLSIILLLTVSASIYQSALKNRIIYERKIAEKYFVEVVKSKYVEEINHFIEEVIDLKDSYYFKKFSNNISEKESITEFFRDKIKLNEEIALLRISDISGNEIISVQNKDISANSRKSLNTGEISELGTGQIYLSQFDINFYSDSKLKKRKARVITAIEIDGKKYFFEIQYFIEHFINFVNNLEKPIGSFIFIFNSQCKHLGKNQFFCVECAQKEISKSFIGLIQNDIMLIDSLKQGQKFSENNLLTFSKVQISDLDHSGYINIKNFKDAVVLSVVKENEFILSGEEKTRFIFFFNLFAALFSMIIGYLFYRKKLDELKKTDEIVDSENRFRVIFNSVEESIFVLHWDLQDNIRFIMMNQKALSTIGKGYQTGITYNIYEFIPKTEREQLLKHLDDLKEGKSSFLESKVITYDKRVIPVEANIRPISLSGNTYMLVILRDISERKLAHEKITENERKYRALFDDNNVPMIIIDPETKQIVDANKTAEDFYGWRKDEIKRMKITEINAFPTEKIEDLILKAKKREQNKFIFKHKISDGTVRNVEVTSSPILIAGRELLVSIVHDISDRKQIEESISTLTSEFVKYNGSEFFDKITSYICKKFHLDMVIIGKFEDEEKRVNVLSCYNGNEYLDLDYYDLENTPCSDVKKNKCNLLSENVSIEYSKDEMLVQNGIKTYWGFALQGKDGEIIGLVVLLSKTYIYKKELVQAVLNVFIESIASEIERMKINAKLKISEEKFRKAFNSSLDALTLTTIDRAIYLDVNQAFENITGYRKEEVLGKSAFDINIWYDLKDRAKVVKSINEKGYIENFTCKFVRKNGDILYGLLSATIIEVSGVKNLLMIARDVTEMELAKQKIYESEKKYRVLFNRAPIGILVTDAYMQIIDYNNNLKSIFAIKDDENISGLNINSINCFKSFKFDELFNKAVVEKERYEAELYNENNEQYLRVVCSALTNSKGTVESVYFGIEDITEKVKVKKELDERKYFIENVATQTPNIIYIFDLDTQKNIYINKNLREMLGYSKGEVPEDSIELVEKVAHPDDLRVFENLQNRTIDWTESYVHHYELRLKDALGRWRWFWGREKKFKMEGSKIKSLIGFLSEITALKEKELKIRENEKKFRYIYENSLAGLFETTFNGEIVNCNNVMANIYGYKAASELIGSKAQNFYINKLERDKYINILSTKGRIENYEMQMITKDGKKIWVLENAAVLENGNIFGACFDITDRKIPEEKIHSLTSHLTSVYESSNMIIFSLDKNYRYLSFNSAHYDTMRKIWGVEIEHGKSMLDYIKNEEDRGKAKLNFDRAIKGESFILVEEYGDKKLYRTFYEDSYSPLFNYEGEIIGLTCFIRDITQRVKNEQQIKMLSDVVEQNPVSVVITDLEGNIEYVNEHFTKITGYSFEEAKGKNLRILKTNFHSKEFYKEMWETILSGKTWNGVFKNRKKNGKEYWEDAIISPILNHNGNIINFCALKTDITEKIETSKKLEQSERSYRTLAENSPLGIIIHDKGRILFASEKAVEFLKGENYNQLRGLNFRNFLENETDEKLTTIFSKIYESDSLPTEIYKMNTLEGKKDIFYAEMMSSVIYFKEKKAVQSVFYDVTERIRLKEKLEEYNKDLEKTVAERTSELKQSEEKFRALAEHSKDVIMRFDLKKRHIYVNPVIKEQTGLAPEDFIGKTHAEMNFPGELVEIWEKALDYVIENKKEHRTEFKLPNNIWIDWLLVPEFNEDDSLSAVVTSARDITKIKEASQKYMEALEKEKSLNEMKTEFLSRISHEFKTPLTSVYSSVELLERYSHKWEKSKIEKHYSTMKKNINNLRNLIDELLMLPKIEKKQFVLNPKIHDINNLIENNLEPLKPLLNEHLVVKVEKHLASSKIIIDEKVFSTIFTNLVSNAIKYSPNGGEIIITVSDNKGRLNINVKDQGLGIPEKDMNKLFERFFRADNIGTILGSGLGLTIVKSYVDELKGSIQVKSKENEGSEFIVSIPVDFINE